MKIVSGGLSNKSKRRGVFLVLCLVLSLTVLFSVAYHKGGEKKTASKGDDYLYGIYESEVCRKES